MNDYANVKVALLHTESRYINSRQSQMVGYASHETRLVSCKSESRKSNGIVSTHRKTVDNGERKLLLFQCQSHIMAWITA